MNLRTLMKSGLDDYCHVHAMKTYVPTQYHYSSNLHAATPLFLSPKIPPLSLSSSSCNVQNIYEQEILDKQIMHPTCSGGRPRMKAVRLRLTSAIRLSGAVHQR